MNHVKKEKDVRATRNLVPTLSAIRLNEHPCTHKEPLLHLTIIHAHSPDGGHLAIAVSKMPKFILGGVRLHGLRTDRVGNNKVSRTIKGRSNVE